MTKPSFFKKLGSIFGGSKETSTEATATTSDSATTAATPVTDSAVRTAAVAPSQPVAPRPSTETVSVPVTATDRGLGSKVSDLGSGVKPSPAPTPARQVPPPPRPATTAFVSIPDTKFNLEQIAINDGPMVKIVARGGVKNYAVCPHCEAMWNIRDRLMVIVQKRVDKSLTCAACEKPVSLPPDINLRKL